MLPVYCSRERRIGRVYGGWLGVREWIADWVDLATDGDEAFLH